MRTILKNRRLVLAAAALALAGCADGMPGHGPMEPKEGMVWLNHLDLLPGDPSVKTSFTALKSSAVGGLSGLDIRSTTTGEDGIPGGNKVVMMAVDTPADKIITGVRTCYQLSNPASFISQVRLAQVQDPPDSALVLLDDATDLTDPGPVCVDSAPTSIDPEQGAILLSLRVNFANTNHAMVVRAIGLHVKAK